MDFFVEKYFTCRKYLVDRGLYDIRLVALVFVGLIALSVFWSGAKIVQQNYELQQKVEAIMQENSILELENKNKQLQNQYLGTDEFADITARRVFGKALPGEKVYIVPREVALNSLSTQDKSDEPVQLNTEKPQYQKNLESWMSIYFGN